MGHGSYTASDWSKLKTSRGISSAATTSQIFSNNRMKPTMDPRYIGKREARDCEEHPQSTPIMIGVDVTGSMGYLSTQIIKESLNELMQQLYATDYVKDPQLLFAAIGDAEVDRAPLQVTQFESDIRIAEQLMDLWLENAGGDMPEDYELLWYFADRHTSIDSFERRGEKGFCFTIGDAWCHDNLRSSAIQRIFGDQSGDISSRELARRAQEKYHLFHIMIGSNPGNFSNLLPGKVIVISKSDVNYLPEIIITAIQLTKGRSLEEILRQWNDLASRVVRNAFSLVTVQNKKSITF